MFSGSLGARPMEAVAIPLCFLVVYLDMVEIAWKAGQTILQKCSFQLLLFENNCRHCVAPNPTNAGRARKVGDMLDVPASRVLWALEMRTWEPGKVELLRFEPERCSVEKEIGAQGKEGLWNVCLVHFLDRYLCWVNRSKKWHHMVLCQAMNSLRKMTESKSRTKQATGAW